MYTNLFSNILPIIAIWIVSLIVLFIFKIVSVKITKKQIQSKELLDGALESISMLARTGALIFTGIAVVELLLVFIFLSNPLENKNIKTITEAQPTVVTEQIKEQNHDVKKAESMNKQAEQENTKAMEQIFKIADDAEKGD